MVIHRTEIVELRSLIWSSETIDGGSEFCAFKAQACSLKKMVIGSLSYYKSSPIFAYLIQLRSMKL